MKPKKGWHSRTNNLHTSAALAALVMALGAKWMPGVLTVETAALIAGGLLAVFSAIGAWLKADDRRKQSATTATIAPLPTVGAIVERKAVFGADRAHPRCEHVTGRHRCTGLDGHAGPHSVPRGVTL